MYWIAIRKTAFTTLQKNSGRADAENHDQKRRVERFDERLSRRGGPREQRAEGGMSCPIRGARCRVFGVSIVVVSVAHL